MRLRARTSGVWGCLISLPGTLLAKQPSDYVPPPYPSRFAISLFALAPLAILLAALSYFPLKKYDLIPTRRVLARLLAIGAFCLWVGAGWAATDALNDEGWNPAMSGTFCLSFLVPLRIFLIPNSLTRQERTVAAAVAFLLLFLPLLFLADYWVKFGLKHGWPTLW